MVRKFPPQLCVDPVSCGSNSWLFTCLSYLNHILSLESLQIFALRPGPVRYGIFLGISGMTLRGWKHPACCRSRWQARPGKIGEFATFFDSRLDVLNPLASFRISPKNAIGPESRSQKKPSPGALYPKPNRTSSLRTLSTNATLYTGFDFDAST